MPDGSFDGVLSDVPYGFGSHQPTPSELIAYLDGAELNTGGDFMGNDWRVPSVRTWSELSRALKPGAHLLSFSGTRTVDLIAMGIRMGGFEVRDTITFAWVYGTGSPKSDSPDRHGGYGNALKPALEPITLGRKPCEGTMASTFATYGTGMLNIDGSRVDYAGEEDLALTEAKNPNGGRTAEYESPVFGTYGRVGQFNPKGRWPANLILDEAAGALLDQQSGERPGMSGGGVHAADYAGGMFGGIDSPNTARGDTGGASRFFWCPKASRFERDLGCDGLPDRTVVDTVKRKEGSKGSKHPRAGAGRTATEGTPIKNHHPSVKPIALCTYLAGLILPPKRDGHVRRILVPYCGSGSEMIGCLLAGWDEVVGIEMDPEFWPIARARLALAETNPGAFAPDLPKPKKAPAAQTTLTFGITE